MDSSDGATESMNELDKFIRLYSTSIGVEGMILLGQIQRKIVLHSLQKQMNMARQQEINLINIQSKFKKEIDYLKWCFSEGSIWHRSFTENDSVLFFSVAKVCVGNLFHSCRRRVDATGYDARHVAHGWIFSLLF